MKPFLILFIILFALSSLYMTDSLNSIGREGIFGISLLILLLFLALKKDRLIYNNKLLIIFYLFTLFSVISALVNSDIGLLYGAIVLLTLYIILTIVFINLVNKEGNKFIFKAILISHLPLIILSFLFGTYGGGGSFEGIFYTSNAMGSVAATLLVLILTVFLNDIEIYISSKERGIKLKLIGSLILLSLTFMLIVITGSRTSFIAALVLLTAGIFFVLCFLWKRKRILNLFFKIIPLVFIVGSVYIVIYFIMPINELLYKYIFYKFEVKAQSGDILDGRGYIWSETMQTAGLFGGGREFFRNFSHSAHNTFISLLGQYGWLSLVLFLCFLLVSVIYAIRYAFRAREDKYRYLPILMLIVFLALSMGESMMFKLSMIASFCCIGVVTSYKKNSLVTNES